MRILRFLYVVSLLLLILTLSGCGAAIPDRPATGRHLTPTEPASALIPGIVDKAPPVVLPPEPEKKPERYSVVVYDVPVRELLFAMARDASLNIDVHPAISGNITLNAINQTLPQILSRIARQVDTTVAIEHVETQFVCRRKVVDDFRLSVPVFWNCSERKSRDADDPIKKLEKAVSG